jgi:hypothetical protein
MLVMELQPAPDPRNDLDRILGDTERRIRDSQAAHWSAHDVFDELGRGTMLATLMGGAFISTASAITLAFPAIFRGYETAVAIGMFLLGSLVSTLSVLLAVMRWPERAQAHLNAANAYSTLRRRVEILRLGLPESQADLPRLVARLANLSELSPAVPAKIWTRAVNVSDRRAK